MKSPSILALAALLGLAGCASYVNIPSDGRDTAFNAINVAPVPMVMEKAVAFALSAWPDEEPYGVVLPEGASINTYRQVAGEMAEPLHPDEAGQHAAVNSVYEVLAIYIRGNEALVTILLPDAWDGRVVGKVQLTGGFGGWSVTSSNREFPSASTPPSTQTEQTGGSEQLTPVSGG